MSRTGDLYLQELERRMAELIDQGLSEEEAYELAGDQAHELMADRLADMADRARMRAKEGR